jgi:hypothetical protein
MRDWAAWVVANLTVVRDHGGNELTAVCPRCGREKLAVRLDRPLWQCWVCRYRGRRAGALIAEVTGVDPGDAVDWTSGPEVAADIGPLSAVERRGTTYPVAPLPPLRPLSDIQRRYLASRGVPDWHIPLYGLTGVVDDGTTAGWLLSARVVIPVTDASGRRVYWTARAVLPQPPKTLNCPSPAKLAEWGLDVLLGVQFVSPGSPIVLVEGPMDALVCGPGFVATLGAGLSARQAGLIAELRPSEVVVAYDPDEAGDNGREAVERALRGLVPVRHAHCPAGTDPADIGRVGMLRHCQRATSREALGIAPLK